MKDYSHFNDEHLDAAIEYCETEKQRCLDIGFIEGTGFWDSFLKDLYLEQRQRSVCH